MALSLSKITRSRITPVRQAISTLVIELMRSKMAESESQRIFYAETVCVADPKRRLGVSQTHHGFFSTCWVRWWLPCVTPPRLFKGHVPQP